MSVKFLYNHNKSNSIGEELKQLISDAQDEIIIVAPYISKNPIINIIDVLDGIKIRILTRLSLDDFISSSSDINILNKLIKNPNIEVRYYSNLHAKIYVIDGKKAVITSANFTQNGMYNNLEYGVLIEEGLKDIKQDINNLWNNGGIVNEEIIVSIQDKLSILEVHKNQEYKIKSEIKELNKQIIEQKRSHPYKKESSNKDTVSNSISEYKALELVINECGMENTGEKIVEVYELIKFNIPEDVRKACAFRYRKNKSRVDVAVNIMNYRIFLLPYMNKPIAEIIYPKEDFYNLRTIILQERLNTIEKWEFKNFECYILYFTFDEILKLDEVHWKSFKEACLIAYNGKKSRNRDSNMIVNWRSVEEKFYIIDEKKNVYAIGKNVKDGFVVLKGSRVSTNIENSLKGSYFDLRLKLINEGVIAKSGDEMVFEKDYRFTKSSPAASVVLGRNETGMKYWKLKNGMTLGEYLKGKDE
ncbi:DUF4357 domain-containing protein [Hathewaya massiliensis]|uniref:DUF4357 domain-containing protein n=1 Tax=Hathewaya massiliensis TaxID=1964382 RepID=UPI00163CA840|nr:DUF4357 domain-containing protein [Hathewaya massiliensis]